MLFAMRPVLGGLAEFERDLIRARKSEAGRAPWRTASGSAESRRSPIARNDHTYAADLISRRQVRDAGR